MARKVGILGGTFDPIHIGHLILGENAWNQFGLEQVWFLPSANPPHKPNCPGRPDIGQRIEMVKLAIRGNPHFALSLAEADQTDYCYTSETLKRLNREHPDTTYYFILGADSLFSFETWRNPGEICRRCVLAVAVRDHVEELRFREQIACLKGKYDARIEVLQTPNIDISSRQIRSWRRNGAVSLRYYVPDAVIDYIAKNKIYTECEEY